jgi:hypothetical protein
MSDLGGIARVLVDLCLGEIPLQRLGQIQFRMMCERFFQKRTGPLSHAIVF